MHVCVARCQVLQSPAMTKQAHRAVHSASDTLRCAGKYDEQKPKCWSDEASSRQYPILTGTWEDSTEEGFEGFYDATEECPAYGHDFDCRQPSKGAAMEPACMVMCSNSESTTYQ